MSEPADKLAAEPGGDPNYILSQEEFHASQELMRAGVTARHDDLLRHLDGLRKTGGWLFISLGLWALMIGWTLVTGNEKGRRG